MTWTPSTPSSPPGSSRPTPTSARSTGSSPPPTPESSSATYTQILSRDGLLVRAGEEWPETSRGSEGGPGPLGQPEPVGQHPQHRRVVAQPQVGAAPLDALPPRPAGVPARRPVHDAVGAGVDRRRRHAQR